MTDFRFQIPHRLDDVDAMVVRLASEAEHALPMEARFRFELSVSEALTNLVTHAKTDVKDAVIDIRLAVGDAEVSIEICDPTGSAPFDLRAHAPDLSNVAPTLEGGRGLGLIMECADSVAYGPSENQNSLKLTFVARP
jgi:serine/threonine-protein kinase RsbW